MKKFFTLVAASLLTMAVFAADAPRPSVTLKSSKKYEVVIDGKSYSTNGITNVAVSRGSIHTIKVYERGRGLFRGKKLVSSSSFRMSRNDVDINVDFRGQISISQDRFGRDNDWKDGRHNDRDDRKDDHRGRF